jgi:hypothetical protein
MRPRDTSPEAWQVFLEAHRRLSPGEKLRRTLTMSDEIRELAIQGLRRSYPDAGEREIYLRTARLVLGRDLASRVFGQEFDQLRWGNTQRVEA